jgi:hypothetical protein
VAAFVPQTVDEYLHLPATGFAFSCQSGWQPLASPAAARIKIALRAWRTVALDYPSDPVAKTAEREEESR